MNANSVNLVVQDIWKEKLDISSLKKQILTRQESVPMPELIDVIVQTVYNGATTNGVKYLNDGLNMEIFSPILVVESITKLPLGKKFKCFVSALDIMDNCLSTLRFNSENESSLSVCKAMSKGTFWTLENTIEIYKSLYVSLRDNLLSPDPETLIKGISKAQMLLKKLIFSPAFCNLNFVGKLSFGEEFSALQIQAKELFSLQIDIINTKPLYCSFETHFKEFMNCITRFLNTSPMFLDFDRPHGSIPNEQLFTFLQFQVLEYLSISCKKLANVLDNWMKVENIPIDQAFVDLFRFSIHNILIRSDQFEQMVFVGYMVFKLPNILCQLNFKYTQENIEQSITIPICQRLAAINFDNINAMFSCDVYKMFLTQCQYNRGLDVKQVEHLLNLRQSPPEEKVVDGSILSKLFASAKKHEEILRVLSLPVDENREQVVQELATLVAAGDLILILTTLACTDNMKKFVNTLIRINSSAEKCSTGMQDVFADQRADLFNHSFLLLTYTGTIFGEKVFLDIDKTFESSFFSRWQKNCTKVTSRMLYSQKGLDQMLDPIPISHSPSNTNADWTENCWSAGMIVKELTQAHLRRIINTEDLQKVCEGFRNRRPALCICAMTWLCSQYKTMPVTERSRMVRVINLFKRPTNSLRAALLPPILNKYSIPLEPDLQAATGKNKTANPEQPKSAGAAFTSILRGISSSSKKVKLDQNIFKSIRSWHSEFGLAAFAESIVKLILQSGKEEEAKFYEELCLCLILMEPNKILKETFTHVLKKFFHCPTLNRSFTDPQGSCLARCLSRSLVTSLILLAEEPSEIGMQRPSKLQRLTTSQLTECEELVQYFATFLEDAAAILSLKKKNAVSNFIINLIEQISMTTSLLKPSICIDQSIALKILEQLPITTSRDTISMLCNLTSGAGQDTAARFLLRHSSMLT